MNLFRKGFVLLFALLFPVIIFLFLKFFGENEYELSVYSSSCSNLIENLFSESNIGEVNIQEFGKPQDYIISVQKQSDDQELEQEVVTIIKNVLSGEISVSSAATSVIKNWE